MVRRFFWFCAGGALGFAADGAMLWSLIELGASPYLARLPAFAVAVWVTWRWHLSLTFADRTHEGGGLKGLVRYLSTQAGGLAVNLGVYWLLLLLLPPFLGQPLLALAFASGAALGFNWRGASRWVFRDKAPDRIV